MQIHLYTSLMGVELAKENKSFRAWTKELKEDGDIHISVDIKEYSILKLSVGSYSIEKI